MKILATLQKSICVGLLLTSSSQSRADEAAPVLRDVLAMIEQMVDGMASASIESIEQRLKHAGHAHCVDNDARHGRVCKISVNDQSNVRIDIDSNAAKPDELRLSVVVYAENSHLSTKEVAQMFSEGWREFAPGRCERLSLIFSDKRRHHALARIVGDIVVGKCDFNLHSVHFTYLEGLPPPHPKY